VVPRSWHWPAIEMPTPTHGIHSRFAPLVAYGSHPAKSESFSDAAERTPRFHPGAFSAIGLNAIDMAVNC